MMTKDLIEAAAEALWLHDHPASRNPAAMTQTERAAYRWCARRATLCAPAQAAPRHRRAAPPTLTVIEGDRP